MPARISIGEDDFRFLREQGAEYVDKTSFIEMLNTDPSRALLLPRPRRFGKTLAMSMLYHYYARQDYDSRPLFEGLYIDKVGGLEHRSFQRHPTIFLTFKDLKPSSIQEWDEMLRQKLQVMAEGFQQQIQPQLRGHELLELESFLDEKASDYSMKCSLLTFSRWLERAYGERVVILIDEYDSPIQEAWMATPLKDRQASTGDFDTLYGRVVKFFRGFFGNALKGNPHIQKAVVTGILRVAKESIFSDVNNLSVCTILDEPYAEVFGFQEEEVSALLERQNQSHRFKEARDWYNGYVFGGKTIYNPWSILNFIYRPNQEAQPFWLQTSANTLIKELLVRHALRVEGNIRTWMAGGAVEVRLESRMVFATLRSTSSRYSTSCYLRAI